MTTGTSTARALAAELDQRLPPGCLLTGPDYDRGRRVWNGAIDHAPALIVRPHTPNEIPTTILAAQHHGVPISVRGGGHDWAGRSVRHGGLVIDLSAMNRVVVDPQTRLATLQGGATTGDVIRAAQAHRLSAATGTVGGVGMAGLALGGGYGPMIGRYGLALDNLIGAEVVLADGRCVAASPSREPELYWALRGGGGNFGVVTSLSVQLHPVPDVLAGLILYPWHQAAHAWTQLDDILAVAPDELTVQAGILRGPEGGPLLFLSPVWCGDLAAGETTLQPLLRLGTPLSTRVEPMPYADMLGLFDAHVVSGRHYTMRTRTVASCTPEVISTLLAAGQHQTSTLSAVSVHHFHGAAARAPLDATAFGIRQPHYMIEILAAWQSDDAPARHLAWADTVATKLAPHALPGGYPNLLGPTDDEQIAHAFGANTNRLRAAKNYFDPSSVFSAIPLPT
jgi:FAD binding domain